METQKEISFEISLPDIISGYLALSLDDNDLVLYANCGRSLNYVSISIQEIVAYQVHEEFCHPDMDIGMNLPVPRGPNNNKSVYYPAIEISNSDWISSFSENRLRDHRRESAKHYRFISYSNVVDVIANSYPAARSVSKNEYYEVERFIKNALT